MWTIRRRLAESVEHATLDFRVVSLSPTLGVEITQKKERKEKKKKRKKDVDCFTPKV